MSVGRRGFFAKRKKACAQLLASSAHTLVEYAGFFTAFLCDTVDLGLTASNNSNKTSDICCGIIPSAFFLFSIFFSCCCPSSERKTNQPVGEAALSFLGCASYLLTRTVVDLSLVFWARDYSNLENYDTREDLIINGTEVTIELIFLLYMCFEKRMKDFFNNCFEEDLLEDRPEKSDALLAKV